VGFQHYYAGTDTVDREVTKLLCPSIGKDVQVELLRDVVAKIPVFSGCTPEFIELLTSLLERVSLPAQSTLFSIGDPGDAMYIIHAGVLDVLGRKAKIRELRKHDFVGELSLFSSFPRSATVVTNTYCVLYKLSRFHTELVLGSFPTAADGIKKVVGAIIEKTQQKSSLSKSATRPPIKPRRDSSKEDLSTPGRTESWTGKTPATRKQSGVVVPAESAPSLTDSPLAAPPSTTPLRRTPRLLQRVMSIKKRRVSDAMKDVYDEYTAPRVTAASPRPWWAGVLLKQALDCSSRSRLAWVLGLQFVLIFNWCWVPLQLSFPAFNHADWFVFVLNGATDAILWTDLYVNFNLAFMQASEKIRDTTKTAEKYLCGAFAVDLLCVLPFEAFAAPTWQCLARVPRLLRYELASLSSRRRSVLTVFLYLQGVACARPLPRGGSDPPASQLAPPRAVCGAAVPAHSHRDVLVLFRHLPGRLQRGGGGVALAQRRGAPPRERYTLLKPRRWPACAWGSGVGPDRDDAVLALLLLRHAQVDRSGERHRT
jgi:hypothetical protein